jgi:hypothetical protein
MGLFSSEYYEHIANGKYYTGSTQTEYYYATVTIAARTI